MPSNGRPLEEEEDKEISYHNIYLYTQKRPSQLGADIHTPQQQTKHPHLTTRCSAAYSAIQRNLKEFKYIKVESNNAFTRYIPR
jgi:hypothetical protein